MIRTVTYDTATHKIVPIEPTDDMLNINAEMGSGDDAHYAKPSELNDAYTKMIAAAPEYQDSTQGE